MDQPETRPIEVAGTFLRAMTDARVDRCTIDTRHAAATEADKILGSWPSLDECVDDWADQLYTIAAKHITPLTGAGADGSGPTTRTTGVPGQSRRLERRLCQKVEIGACIAVIRAIGSVVHALCQGPDDAPVVRLYCSDGARAFVYVVEIILARRSPSDRLGVYVSGPLLFLGTRRLLRAAGPLCVPTGIWKMGGGWRSVMSTNDALQRLLTDLVNKHIDDWTAFAKARYAQLAALPDALVRHGWTVVPDDQSPQRPWAWTGRERPAELDGMVLGIVHPDGLRLWVMWKNGTLLVTNQEHLFHSLDALSVFFDRAPPTPITTDDDDDDTTDSDDTDAPHTNQDWWAGQDAADKEILLTRERAWMTRRGYISSAVTHAHAQYLHGKDDRPPLVLGRTGDTADEMAVRVDAYADYARGAYGPVDEVTGAHLNGPWSHRRLKDALAAAGSEGRLSHYEGPIDPAGPLVTNSIIEYDLGHVFGHVSGIATDAMPDVIAHAHLVGESCGAATAHFSVIVRHCPYHETLDSDYEDDDDDSVYARPKARRKTRHRQSETQPLSYKALVDALKEIAAEPTQDDDGDVDHAADSVHPLVERNARASRLSARTAAVLYERHISGDGIDFVRAHAWITDRLMAAIRLFEEAAAAFALAP
ncbi:hypothetical protein psal_cds_1084 [Pandoravirus salinus]|uniref:Uncharacterized protein n=1 Tax=Pandoravirus salinus TaxID=1349410 RepID=S4W4N2_9VIRU|nr:hypothetical protein psal_cds_1084 [Pandoravirus salinus]AGO85300.1 hypothetical protein psal_cds_1084 [Pandoravirus salinus]